MHTREDVVSMRRLPGEGCGGVPDGRESSKTPGMACVRGVDHVLIINGAVDLLILRVLILCLLQR
jgi:hypothetical protein